MPSCVVKLCKSNSSYNKKSQGITFHRFPTKGAFREEWIDILRESREENNWKPSKTSIICSKHFESSAFYTTKNGLIRVAPYSVPTLFLKKQSFMRDQSAADRNDPNPLQEQTIEQEQSVVVDINDPRPLQEFIFQQTIKQEQSVDYDINDPRPLQEQTIKQEQSVDYDINDPRPLQEFVFEQTIQPEQSVADINDPRPLQESLASKKDHLFFVIESVSTSTCLPSLADSPVVTASDCDDIEQPLSMLFTPGQRRMKEIIMQKDVIIKSKNKKINTLSRHNKRLQTRNNLLKDIIKTLKNKLRSQPKTF